MSNQKLMNKPSATLRRNLFIVALMVVSGVTAVLGTDLFRSLSSELRTYNNVVKNLLSEYVDEVDSQTLITASIEGMLEDLDPYTTFIREEDQTSVGMLTQGSYGGVGIRLGTRQKKLTVISPMEGTPASRAGVRPGDLIIKIDSTNTDEFNTSKAAMLIRGKPGSKVTLTFQRPGEDLPFPVLLTREKIKVNDLPFYGIIDGLGYITLSRFSRNTSKEVSNAIRDLQSQGMTGLVLDLRSNPGGLLSDAVKMVDAMVEPGLHIVDTRGRTKKSTRSFNSTLKPVLDPETPLVVLVNGGSASASEIVAGAIQDLDRGVIIGTETFGKGLVQTILPLGKKTSIKLTTAKYYTPSGRLIQKEDYRDNDVFTGGDANRDSLYTTLSGREVKGGGGIVPDVESKPTDMGVLTRKLWNQSHFFTFATSNREKYDLALPVVITDGMIADFKTYIDEQDFELKYPGEKQLETFEDAVTEIEGFEGDINLSTLSDHFEGRKASAFVDERDGIERGLRLEFSIIAGGLKARIRSALLDDPIFKEAANLINDGVAYNDLLSPSASGTQVGSRE